MVAKFSRDGNSYINRLKVRLLPTQTISAHYYGYLKLKLQKKERRAPWNTAYNACLSVCLDLFAGTLHGLHRNQMQAKQSSGIN